MKGQNSYGTVNVFVVVLPMMGSRVDRRHRYCFDRYLVLTAGGIGGKSANRLLPTAVVQINTEVNEGCHHKDTETQRGPIAPGPLCVSVSLW